MAFFRHRTEAMDGFLPIKGRTATGNVPIPPSIRRVSVITDQNHTVPWQRVSDTAAIRSPVGGAGQTWHLERDDCATRIEQILRLSHERDRMAVESGYSVGPNDFARAKTGPLSSAYRCGPSAFLLGGSAADPPGSSGQSDSALVDCREVPSMRHRQGPSALA
jgi:hypothetical protein